jgi:hypothetical protein
MKGEAEKFSKIFDPVSAPMTPLPFEPVCAGVFDQRGQGDGADFCIEVKHGGAGAGGRGYQQRGMGGLRQ